MVSITLFLMRSAIVSFDSSHPNYRTVGIWLSWQEVVMRAVESPVLEFRGLRRWHQYCFWLVYWLWSPVPVSIVLLVFLVPLNSYKLITIPSVPFHMLLQHSEFSCRIHDQPYCQHCVQKPVCPCMSSQRRSTSWADFLLLVWIPWQWTESRKTTGN